MHSVSAATCTTYLHTDPTREHLRAVPCVCFRLHRAACTIVSSAAVDAAADPRSGAGGAGAAVRRDAHRGAVAARCPHQVLSRQLHRPGVIGAADGAVGASSMVSLCHHSCRSSDGCPHWFARVAVQAQLASEGVTSRPPASRVCAYIVLCNMASCMGPSALPVTMEQCLRGVCRAIVDGMYARSVSLCDVLHACV
jgi:hypothetical protein